MTTLLAQNPSALSHVRNKQKAAFLEAFTKSYHIRASAKAAGIDPRRHYEWLANDPAYAAAYREAEVIGIDVLEDEATRRAVEGIQHPVYYKGVRVDTYPEYSDTLLIFKLKGARPEKYKDGPTTYVDNRSITHVDSVIQLIREARKQLRDG